MKSSLKLVNTHSGFVDNALECYIEDWDVVLILHGVPTAIFVIALALAFLDAERGLEESRNFWVLIASLAHLVKALGRGALGHYICKKAIDDNASLKESLAKTVRNSFSIIFLSALGVWGVLSGIVIIIPLVLSIGANYATQHILLYDMEFFDALKLGIKDASKAIGTLLKLYGIFTIIGFLAFFNGYLFLGFMLSEIGSSLLGFDLATLKSLVSVSNMTYGFMLGLLVCFFVEPLWSLTINFLYIDAISRRKGQDILRDLQTRIQKIDE